MKRIALGILLAAFVDPVFAAGTWSYVGPDTGSADHASLNFGELGSEETTAHFGCEPHSGRVKLFIGETTDQLQPDQSIEATLSAGGAKLTVSGKTLRNELAGVPSFEGAFDAAEPFLRKFAAAKTLVIVIGPVRQNLPLDGLRDKAAKFAKVCAKP